MSMFERVASLAASVVPAAAPNQQPDLAPPTDTSALVWVDPSKDQRAETPAARDVLALGETGQAEIGSRTNGTASVGTGERDDPGTAPPATGPTTGPTSAPREPSLAEQIRELRNLSVDELRARERTLDRHGEQLSVLQTAERDVALVLQDINGMVGRPGVTHDQVIQRLATLETGLEGRRVQSDIRINRELSAATKGLAEDPTEAAIAKAQADIQKALKRLNLKPEEIQARLTPPADVVEAQTALRAGRGAVADSRGEVDITSTDLTVKLDGARAAANPKGYQVEKVGVVSEALMKDKSETEAEAAAAARIAAVRAEVLKKGAALGLTEAELDAVLVRIADGSKDSAVLREGIANVSEATNTSSAFKREVFDPAIQRWKDEQIGTAKGEEAGQKAQEKEDKENRRARDRAIKDAENAAKKIGKLFPR